MAIELGDAVLRFLGDSTQLELAFDSIESQAATKLAPATASVNQLGASLEGAGKQGAAASVVISESFMRVAQATAANTAAQKSLAEALALVKKNGADDTAAVLALAAAQQTAAASAAALAVATKEAGSKTAEHFREGKAEIMSLNRELGLGVDRHLAGWISKLPGVGAALSAAFNVTMVLVILKLLADGIEKLTEWREKSEMIREAWVKVDSDFRDTSIHIQEEIEQQEQAFIRMTQGPVAALDFALQHMRSTADQTLKSIVTELEALASQFSDQKKFLDFGSGFTKATKEVNKFKADLVSAMHEAADAHPDDKMAGYRKGIELTTTEYDRLNDIILKNNKLLTEGPLSNFGTGKIISGEDAEILERKFAAIKSIKQQLEAGTKLDDDRDKAEGERRAKEAAQRELEVGSAGITATKAVQAAKSALDVEYDKVRYERGQITYAQLLKSEIDYENQSYSQNRSALQGKIALLQEDGVKNQAAIIEAQGHLAALATQHKENLLKIDQESYRKRASEQEKSIQLAISGTKQGTEERVNLENSLAQFLLQTWGAQSDAYQAQLVKLTEARRAYSQEQKRLAAEDNKQELALATDKAKADDSYYTYLVQTARMTHGQLRVLQEQAFEQEHARKIQSLVFERDSMEPQELLARKQINDKIALLDQQAQEHREMFALQTDDAILDSFHQLGLKSADELEREAKVAEIAFKEIEKSGTSSYHDILLAKEKLLNLKIGAALASGDQAQLQMLRKELDQTTLALDRLGAVVGKVNILSLNFFDAWHRGAPKTRDVIVNMAQVAKDMLNAMGAAEASAIQSWILGQESLGTAMRKATAQILAEYAARAAVEAVYWLAYGFAMLASMQYDRAAAAFTAAAELGGFAVVAGSIAAAINPKSTATAGTSSSSSSSITDSSSSQPAAAAPVQHTNIQSFAKGGLVTGPTLAIIGDSVHGSSSGQSREAAIPLDDPAAMTAIGAALAPYLQSSGTTIHVNVKGMISPDNLNKVMKDMSRKVIRGQGNITSSNSFRVTKRS